MPHPITRDYNSYKKADLDEFTAFHLPGQTIVYGALTVNHAKTTIVLGFANTLAAITWIDTQGMSPPLAEV